MAGKQQKKPKTAISAGRKRKLPETEATKFFNEPKQGEALAKGFVKKVAKTARGRRFLMAKEPKKVEDPKETFIVKGNKCSADISSLLHDFQMLRGSGKSTYYKKTMAKSIPIHPFEDETRILKYMARINASVFALGSSSKKRPSRLVMGRLFNDMLLDMVEFKVTEYNSMKDFVSKSCDSTVFNAAPMMVFQGAGFDSDPRLESIKSMFMDFFNIGEPANIVLEGLTTVIVVSAKERESKQDKYKGFKVENASVPADELASDAPQVTFKRFKINFKKSTSTTPKVELEEVGPSFTLTQDRERRAPEELMKQALKVPFDCKEHKKKNVTVTTDEKTKGRLHVGKQDFNIIHTVHHNKASRKKTQQDASVAKLNQPIVNVDAATPAPVVTE